MAVMIVTRLLTGMLVALLAAAPALAQTPREDVAQQLKVLTDAKADDGFAPDVQAIGRSTVLGILEDDATVYLEVTLDKDREYYVAGRCDTGCADLDTSLLDPDYNLLVDDALDNDAPQMTAQPSASGPHLLGVRMTSCAARICYFGIVILSRPARR